MRTKELFFVVEHSPPQVSRQRLCIFQALYHISMYTKLVQLHMCVTWNGLLRQEPKAFERFAKQEQCFR